MGRPHVPTNLKVLNGTINTGRQNAREPKLPSRIPPCPAHLNDEERAAWSYFAGLLEPMQVVTDADGAAYEMLCVTYVHHQRLVEALRSAKHLVYAPKGSREGASLLRTRPELQALTDVARRLLVLLGRFGLTPSDRQKVVQTDGVDGSPYDEFS